MNYWEIGHFNLFSPSGWKTWELLLEERDLGNSKGQLLTTGYSWQISLSNWILTMWILPGSFTDNEVQLSCMGWPVSLGSSWLSSTGIIDTCCQVLLFMWVPGIWTQDLMLSQLPLYQLSNFLSLGLAGTAWPGSPWDPPFSASHPNTGIKDKCSCARLLCRCPGSKLHVHAANISPTNPSPSPC